MQEMVTGASYQKAVADAEALVKKPLKTLVKSARDILTASVNEARARLGLNKSSTPAPHQLNLTSQSVGDYKFLLALRGSVYALNLTNASRTEEVVRALLVRWAHREAALSILYLNTAIRGMMHRVTLVLKMHTCKQYLQEDADGSVHPYVVDWVEPDVGEDLEEPGTADVSLIEASLDNRKELAVIRKDLNRVVTNVVQSSLAHVKRDTKGKPNSLEDVTPKVVRAIRQLTDVSRAA